MRNKKGYTLVELIITLAVIGIMLTPIFNSFIESNRVNLRSRRLISAAYLAQNQLEEIKGLTRGEFNALDINTLDLIGIDHDDWSYNETRTNSDTTNGGTMFDVNVSIENVTDTLGITLKSPTGTIVENERTWHARVELFDATINMSLESTDRAQSTYNTSKTVNLTFNTIDFNYSELVVGSQVFSIFHDNFDDPDNSWIRKIYVNVIGYEGLTDEWSFTVLNNSDYAIDIKPYEDLNGKIKLVVGPSSRSNIYIGNALPILSGSASTSEEWYNVVVTISHNGTVYEVIESTVGK